MSEVKSLHAEAMEYAELAEVARLNGNRSTFAAHAKKALALERRAANSLRDEYQAEPTRSILYRSAASLALDCEEFRLAEQLIAAGLSGDPPESIADELRELLDLANFSKHLDVRGLRLANDEFQMSMTGNLVGPGIADSEEFVTRVKATETMIYRTAERSLGRPFRERGRRRESLKSEVELYVSVPRAASFAVSFKVGHSKQMKLPTMHFGEELVDEVFTCLDLVAHDQEKELQERIREEPYFRNFLALAKQIAPDGDAIKSVGFTARRGKAEKRVVLIGTGEGPKLRRIESVRLEMQAGEVQEFRGRLKYADERDQDKQRVQLVSKERSITIYVPEGMMADIVSPYWGREVTVLARLDRKRLVLESIRGKRR